MTPEELAAIRERAEKATRVPIPGYDGYEADSEGHIWSAGTNWRGYGDRRLVEEEDKDGYSRVRLYRMGRRVRKQVHHLVAVAFHGPPKEGQEVRHLDGCKLRNMPTNLSWGTRKENAEDRATHGHTARGSRNGQAKLNEEEVARIVTIYTSGGVTQRSLALTFGVSQRTVSLIVRGEGWAHVGR